MKLPAILGIVAVAISQACPADLFTIPADAARFTNSAPYSAPAEVSRRMGLPLPPGAYDVSREGFRVIAPASLATNSGWGLFVWISPGHDAYIPQEWAAVFAKHKLIFVAPYLSGNNRELMGRFRLALDAVSNAAQRYTIDRKRVFVGGFSGGGRIASMLAVSYADLFAGAFCVCGVNFYQDVTFSSEDVSTSVMPGAGSAGLSQVRASPSLRIQGCFRPPGTMHDLAKRNSHLYLLTGSGDPNRLETKALFEAGFKRSGYRHVQYREVSGLNHGIPGAAELEKALTFLAP